MGPNQSSEPDGGLYTAPAGSNPGIRTPAPEQDGTLRETDGSAQEGAEERGIRMVLPPPRAYPFVCYDWGDAYWDYAAHFKMPTRLTEHPFRIYAYRGRGTFSRAYAVYNTAPDASGEALVVKLFRQSKERQEVKLQRELGVLEKLQGGPGVVRYYDILNDRDNLLWSDPGMTEQLDLIEDEDVQDIEQQTGNPPTKPRHRVALVFEEVADMRWKDWVPKAKLGELKYVMFQILLTLDFAHSLGIMHRDIKPPNILLGTNFRPVVIDWGQAEFYVPNGKRNVLVGGRSFKSPELVYGGNHPEAMHDYATDIWSFGVTLGSFIFFKGGSNLFFADSREGLITSFAECLGTQDLHDYLSQHPSIVKSRTTKKLIEDRENLTPRQPLAGFFKKRSRFMSDTVIELLDSTMQYDPRKRPTASELLMHPWFASTRTELDEEYDLKGWSDISYAVRRLQKVFARPLDPVTKRICLGERARLRK